MYSKVLNILLCVNGPFEYFRNQTGEKRSLKALKRLTPVTTLQRNWSILYISRVKPFTLSCWAILFRFSILYAEHPHAYGFVSLQECTQNLEDGEVMNGVQTESLTSPRIKDALRYSLYVNRISYFNPMFVSLQLFLFYRRDQNQ